MTVVQVGAQLTITGFTSFGGATSQLPAVTGTINATGFVTITSPFGRCLWGGAQSDVARILVSAETDPDFDGAAYVGLYHPRIS